LKKLISSEKQALKTGGFTQKLGGKQKNRGEIHPGFN
jgi:hypothetical protein